MAFELGVNPSTNSLDSSASCSSSSSDEYSSMASFGWNSSEREDQRLLSMNLARPSFWISLPELNGGLFKNETGSRPA